MYCRVELTSKSRLPLEMAPIFKLTVAILAVLTVQVTVTEGSALLMNFQYGTCLQVIDSSTANNAPLNLTTCHCPWNNVLNAQTWGEQWWAGTANSTLYNGATGKCVTVNGAVSGNGVIINQYDCVNQNNQKWQIYNGAYNGVFLLRSTLTGQCLTAEGGGTYIDQWDCVTIQALAPHQYWRLIQYS